VHRKEFFYKRAKYDVLKYIKDGKEQPGWKYNFMTRKPVYPPFDADNDKNYTIRLLGKKMIADIQCWEFDVIPKKKTTRHLKGKMYFSVNGLDLVLIEGTVADYPIGVKSLFIEIYFKKLGEAYVASRGTYTFVVDIPLFYPHKKFVQTFTSRDDRLIPVK
jgi:hypothetical protein